MFMTLKPMKMLRMSASRPLCCAAALAAAAFAPAASADLVTGVPTGWVLQNYMGDHSVVAFFAGTPCSFNRVTMMSTMSEDDKNRFFTLVLTAKITGKVIGVYYTDDHTGANNCPIVSFYIQN
jgi:hypothetical protein